MSNRRGKLYALTLASPIRQKERGEDSPALALRRHLAHLAANETSPFAKLDSTHIARLTVLDDVAYVGKPVYEEHLKSRYLLFATNFDGDLDTYLTRMAKEIPDEVDAIWRHCVAFPGMAQLPAFLAYMKKCQIRTDFFYPDCPDKTVQQTLRALAVQRAVARFIEEHQGLPAAELKRAFAECKAQLDAAPLPPAGCRSLEEAARSSGAGN